MQGATRRDFLTSLTAAVAGGMIASPSVSTAQTLPDSTAEISLEQVQTASQVLGVQLTDAEAQAILNDVRSNLKNFLDLRKLTVRNSMVPATTFRVLAPVPSDRTVRVRNRPVRVQSRPQDEDIAFASIPRLAALLSGRHISSVQLTELFLDRLKAFGPKLRCVAALTTERAVREARAADEVIKTRQRRHILHGIPYGIKDIFSSPGYPTAWGAEPYREQIVNEESAVIERLSAVGGVLVAKLSTGALAMGDVWYEGRTESPWDPKIGASGSSAGPGSATAAGLVPYAIGTETSGSIVSPSHNSRVTGLRPTFGSVSRAGAMTLSWTMDKVGPMCRSAEDCAIVFGALLGSDPRDPASVDRGFSYESRKDLSDLKFGYFTSNPDQLKAPLPTNLPYIQTLMELGAKLERMSLPRMHPALATIIVSECGAAFDEFTTGDKIDQLKNSAWPATFREARFISAIDHIQTDRVRRTLMEAYEKAINAYDVILVEDRGYPIVYALNLTGHPQILVPFGTNANGAAVSFSLIGPAFSESVLLQVADLVQQRAGHHLKRPDLTVWR